MSQNNLLNLSSVIPVYREVIKTYLSDNLNNEISQTLANMLALHFVTASNLEKNHNQLAEHTVSKIKKYLKHRVIAENDFSISLELFAIAIAEDFENEQDLFANQKSAIMNQFSGEFSDIENKEELLEYIDYALNHEEASKIVNYIISNKKTSLKIFAKALKIKALSKKQDLHRELSSIFLSETENVNISNLVKSTIKTAFILSGCVLGSYAGVLGLGIVAPIAIIPITVLSFKSFAKPIERNFNAIYSSVENIFNREIVLEQKLEKLKIPSLHKSEQRKIENSALQEAKTLVNELGGIHSNVIKEKKEHTKEVMLQAEAIKKKIDTQEH